MPNELVRFRHYTAAHYSLPGSPLFSSSSCLTISSFPDSQYNFSHSNYLPLLRHFFFFKLFAVIRAKKIRVSFLFCFKLPLIAFLLHNQALQAHVAVSSSSFVFSTSSKDVLRNKLWTNSQDEKIWKFFSSSQPNAIFCCHSAAFCCYNCSLSLASQLQVETLTMQRDNFSLFFTFMYIFTPCFGLQIFLVI